MSIENLFDGLVGGEFPEDKLYSDPRAGYGGLAHHNGRIGDYEWLVQ